MLVSTSPMSADASPPLRKKELALTGGVVPPSARAGAGPSASASDDRDMGDPIESAGAAPRMGADVEDATEGEWLFKHDGMVLGPVTAIVLVERIKRGELSADTPLARDGQSFKPMKLIALFREAHEAMLARQRREAEERAYNGSVRRAHRVRALLLAVLFLGPAAGGAVGGHMLMKLQPWDTTRDWVAKVPPLVDLPPRPPQMKETRSAPRVDSPAPSANEAPVKDEERRQRVARSEQKQDEPKEETKDAAPADQGFVKELTNEQAVAPLKDVKEALGACFKGEILANPEIFAVGAMSVDILLAYTITEEGRSANVEIQNRELRGRPVQDCVKKALAGARWPRFQGERKNVTVPFKIKKPKAATTTPSGTPK